MLAAAVRRPGEMWEPFTMTSVLLELLYANQDQLITHLNVAPSDRNRYLESAAGDSLYERAQKQHALTAMLEDRLNDPAILPPPELQVELVAGRARAGQVISLEQDFYFRRDRRADTVLMYGGLNTDRQLRVEAILNAARFPFASTREHLSGRSRVFTVATIVSVESGLVRLRPHFVGWRNWGQRIAGQSGGNSWDREVHPQSVDQFHQVDWTTGATRAQVNIVKRMAEDDVKRLLCEIIGHPFDERDWGGERSDLNIDTLLVNGVQTSSAWLLKGRSVQRTMQVADLGANGDQVERLTTTNAELLVVQHNQLISAAVKNTLAAFAYDMRNPRRYMLMDGNITAMILRDYGLLVT